MGGGGLVWKMISACRALPLSYFWYEPEATLNWLVVAFCMSVSPSPAEWSLSSCPRILPLHLTFVTSTPPPHSALFSSVHVSLHIRGCASASQSLAVLVFCVSVSQLSFSRLVCMHKSTHACRYLHAIILTVRAIASPTPPPPFPPSPTMKRILILSGLTVPSNKRWGGVGSTLRGGQPDWMVWHFVAHCDLRAAKGGWKSRQNPARGGKLLLKDGKMKEEKKRM